MERAKRWAIISLWSGVLFLFLYSTLWLIETLLRPLPVSEGLALVGILLLVASLSSGACAIVFGLMALIAGKSQVKGALCAIVVANVLIVPLIMVGLPLLAELLQAKQPSGASAIAKLRTLASVQELYYTRFGNYATLKQLGDAGYIDSSLVSATAPESAQCGYYYTLTADKDAWSCVAEPITHTGLRGYFIRTLLVHEDGIIYYNTEENSSEFTKEVGRD